MAYMRAADPTELPQGVEFRHYRHHSEPCPIEAAREAVKDIASMAHSHVARFTR